MNGTGDQLSIGSLFSGSGSLDIAVQAIFGGRIAWHADNDPAAAAALRAHWPTVPNIGDVTTVDWRAIADTAPVDIACGGYPCQPFAPAGQRKGADDDRNLWPHFAEAIRRIRPHYVILENVPGHRSLGLSRVLADLAAMRYVGWWRSLRASDIGACHRRERLFVLATNSDTAGAGGRPIPLRDNRNSVRRATAGFRQLNGDIRPQRTLELLPTPEAKNAHAGPDYARMDRAASGTHDLVTAIAYHKISATNFGRYDAAVRRWQYLTRPAPPPTEPNGRGNPRLHAAFAEWMMGWPPGWITDHASREDALRIIGNGVCPQQAIAALEWLRDTSKAAA